MPSRSSIPIIGRSLWLPEMVLRTKSSRLRAAATWASSVVTSRPSTPRLRASGSLAESIAARAGLGVGTIYCRFAGKDALVDAIAETFVQEVDDAAAAAVADPDPARGLERFLGFVGAFNAGKRRYAAALTDRVAGDEVGSRTTDKIRELVRAAVAARACLVIGVARR